jgi:hypothetical protein
MIPVRQTHYQAFLCCRQQNFSHWKDFNEKKDNDLHREMAEKSHQ